MPSNKNQQLGEDASQESAETIALIMEHLKQQPSPADLSGVTQQQIEALYALSFELYNADCFEQAADLFCLLCFYEPRNSKNWIALGAANQHLKKHESAVAAFLMASLYDPLNPKSKLYAAHSFIDLMDLPAALESAQAAIELCHDKADQADIQSRAISLCNALKAQAKN